MLKLAHLMYIIQSSAINTTAKLSAVLFIYEFIYFEEMHTSHNARREYKAFCFAGLRVAMRTLQQHN